MLSVIMIITRTYCHPCANTLSISTTPGKKVLLAPCREACGHKGDLAARGPEHQGVGWAGARVCQKPALVSDPTESLPVRLQC